MHTTSIYICLFPKAYIKIETVVYFNPISMDAMHIKPEYVNDSLLYFVEILRKTFSLRKYFSVNGVLYKVSNYTGVGIQHLFLQKNNQLAIWLYIINELIAVILAVSQDAAVFNIYMFQGRKKIVCIIPLSLTGHYVNGSSICIYSSMDFSAGNSYGCALLCLGKVRKRI